MPLARSVASGSDREISAIDNAFALIEEYILRRLTLKCSSELRGCYRIRERSPDHRLRLRAAGVAEGVPSDVLVNPVCFRNRPPICRFMRSSGQNGCVPLMILLAKI